MNRDELKSIIENVLKEIGNEKAASTNAGNKPVEFPIEKAAGQPQQEAQPKTCGDASFECGGGKFKSEQSVVEEGELPDITAMDIVHQYLYETPYDKEGYMELKVHSPCRLAIGKAGARYKTLPLLQFRAAHSAAQDAVFSDVDEEMINSLDLETFQTRCENKDVYLTRPDLGRRLSEESAKKLAAECEKGKQVYVFAADGLSSAAVMANTKDVMSSLMQGLQSSGISVGKPFFVKYGRVGVMDEVSEITGADVTCVLVGERPGLITATSMSAYIAYKGTIGMPEARRTVISNIHSKGTIPAEAGAHVAEVIKTILEKKASGTDLKL